MSDLVLAVFMCVSSRNCHSSPQCGGCVILFYKYKIRLKEVAWPNSTIIGSFIHSCVHPIFQEWCYVSGTVLDTKATMGSRAGVFTTLKYCQSSGGQTFHTFTQGHKSHDTVLCDHLTGLGVESHDFPKHMALAVRFAG